MYFFILCTFFKDHSSQREDLGDCLSKVISIILKFNTASSCSTPTFCRLQVLLHRVIIESMPGSQKIFRGRPNISVGQPILVQPKYNPT